MPSNTYNPALAALTQKPIGISKAQPTDSRTYYFDPINFLYRPFQSEAEVLTYFPDAVNRKGHASIVVNTGGTIDPDTGILSGGTNKEYWWKDNYTDSGLTAKSTDITQTQKDTWTASATRTIDLQQVLTAGNDSGLSARIASLFLKGPVVTNMTELDTYSTSPTRKVMFPDATGTAVLSVAGIAPNNTTGNVDISSLYYNKTQVDGLVGSGGTSGVSTFNSRSGAVMPTAGDYDKTMVGLANVDNTTDLLKPLSTASTNALALKVDKVSGKSLILDTEITRLGTLVLETGSSIRTKLGVSTLSGSNTGDQDISGKVDKVTGKSLIADTEITRLSAVANVNIIQGSNVTVSGTYPNITISSSGGGGGTSSITAAAGVATAVVPAGRFITAIVFKGPTPNTVKAGLAAGTEDIVASTAMSVRQTTTVMDVFDADTTIYFTKAADTTAIIY